MKVCAVEGCNGKVHGKGYCDKHYRQYKRYGKIRRTNKDPNEIIMHEDYAEIILYDKNCNEKDRALIDLDDVYKVKQYKWCLDAYGYVIGGKDKKIRLHRFIMNCPDDMVVDHINLNPLNNRKSNLRICTKQQNEMNRPTRSHNTSGVTGVSKHKQTNKWRAYIEYNQKYIHLGLFNTKEEAIKARKEAELKYFGKYRYQG